MAVEVDGIADIQALNLPGVAEVEPVVRLLVLEAVHNGLRAQPLPFRTPHSRDSVHVAKMRLSSPPIPDKGSSSMQLDEGMMYNHVWCRCRSMACFVLTQQKEKREGTRNVSGDVVMFYVLECPFVVSGFFRNAGQLHPRSHEWDQEAGVGVPGGTCRTGI